MATVRIEETVARTVHCRVHRFAVIYGVIGIYKAHDEDAVLGSTCGSA